MAHSTYKTALMYKANDSTAYTKLIDIKDYPDLGGLPELLETTTLSDKAQTYVPGVEASEALEFTANYTLDDYRTIKGLKGQELNFAIWFGGTETGGVFTPNGEDGKFKFKGYISVVPTGGDVNAVRDMSLSIIPSSSIELDEIE